MGQNDTSTIIDNTEVSCHCARCGTSLNIVDIKTNRVHPEERGHSALNFIVDPHLCSIYADDNGTRMEQVKNHNDALQKRNTELVEENRRLKANGGV